jgi:hypothetical protein
MSDLYFKFEKPASLLGCPAKLGAGEIKWHALMMDNNLKTGPTDTLIAIASTNSFEGV